MSRQQRYDRYGGRNGTLFREVLGVACCSLGGVLVLSYMGVAGAVGERVALSMFHTLGWLRWGAPVFLICIALHAWFPGRLRLRPMQWVGLTLTTAAALLITSLLRPIVAGSLVNALSITLVGAIGRPVLWVIAVAAGAVGASLLVRVPLLIIIGTMSMHIGTRLFAVGGAMFRAVIARWWSSKPSVDTGDVSEQSSMEPGDDNESRFAGHTIVADVDGESAARRVKSRTVMRHRPGTFIPTFSLSLLDSVQARAESGNIADVQRRIADTFENFGIGVEMAEVSVGPTVTQYTLKPATGVKVAQITALQNDLALALAAHPIRIEAPIPGKALVGIEVPNRKVALVGLREILVHQNFINEAKANGGSLLVALGKDVAGAPFVGRLERMPHMLIAGATGSGKTVAINAVLTTLLYQKRPEELKLLLIDPKRVELTAYNGIPHLIAPVITEVKKTIAALKWALREMDRRFSILAASGKRDITSYNATADEPIPYLVIVIDELADLMVVAASEVEASIIRIAQMARAVGIHLIVATQRPSVDIITGLIKANITTRVAFAVASSIDSRTILDTAGAEKLLGRGDCLFVTADLSKPKRLQGAFVSEAETQRVVRALKDLGEPEYEEVALGASGGGVASALAHALDGGGEDGEEDPLLEEAIVVIRQAGRASASLLQRRLKVGYARAARILDILESRGIIGPGDGAKPREVLIGGSSDGTIPSSAESGVDNEISEQTDGENQDTEEVFNNEE